MRNVSMEEASFVFGSNSITAPSRVAGPSGIEKSEGILADGAEIPFAEGEISLAAQRVYIPHAGGFIFPEGGNIKVKFYLVNYVAIIF